MLSASDNWGPFHPALSHAERVARLRSLRAIVQMSVRASLPLQKALWLAESGDEAELQAAMIEVNRLPALTQRHVLSAYIRHQTFKTTDGSAPGKARSHKTPPKTLEGEG